MWLIIYPSVLLQGPGLPFPLSSPAVDTEFSAPGSFLSPVPLSLLLFVRQLSLAPKKGQGVNTPRGSFPGVCGERPRTFHMVSLWISSRTALSPTPAGDPVINLSSVYSLPCLTFPVYQLWLLGSALNTATPKSLSQVWRAQSQSIRLYT